MAVEIIDFCFYGMDLVLKETNTIVFLLGFGGKRYNNVLDSWCLLVLSLMLTGKAKFL